MRCLEIYYGKISAKDAARPQRYEMIVFLSKLHLCSSFRLSARYRFPQKKFPFYLGSNCQGIGTKYNIATNPLTIPTKIKSCCGNFFTTAALPSLLYHKNITTQKDVKSEICKFAINPIQFFFPETGNRQLEL